LRTGSQALRLIDNTFALLLSARWLLQSVVTGKVEGGIGSYTFRRLKMRSTTSASSMSILLAPTFKQHLLLEWLNSSYRQRYL
jgi:hypothetical protein